MKKNVLLFVVLFASLSFAFGQGDISVTAPYVAGTNGFDDWSFPQYQQGANIEFPG